MDEQTAARWERYGQLLHAMQTGVAHMMHRDENQTSPKHLRVGVNNSLCCQAALVKVLVAKGVITEEEYAQACADEMELEVGRYENELKAVIGTDVDIKLH